MTNLQTGVVTAMQKVSFIGQKQLQANEAFKEGAIFASEYKKIELSVLKAEHEVKKPTMK
ncbi:MAG: hypothetical protein LBE09_08075 [Christensenellaceae bacterium]|jgi:hypothetical protein|nr:hypothetical protein [Christensenellaceae bacterium]